MVRYPGLVAACLCAMLIADTAEAQYFGRNKVHYDRLDFRLLQTDHFDIYYYAEEEVATRHAARMAERWYARFSRVLGHTFAARQPLVLYASHPHFSQTNLTAGSPGEGTGGFTERVKTRIAMPFAAGLGETDHVLGHEIAHAFQIDIAKSVKQDAFSLPGWFIEGMAEYLSLGAATPNTVMWVRDSAAHGTLPSLKQLGEPRFFPYRYGHAFWSYLAGRYGDEVIRGVLRSKARGGAVARVEEVTGVDATVLTDEWHASIRGNRGVAAARALPSVGPGGSASEPTLPVPADDAVPVSSGDRARLHVGPSLSPDGRHVMFLSERDRLSLDLFMADIDSGRVVGKIVSMAADPHFDSLQYIHSAGAWDAEGRRFAMTAISGGDPMLVIVDVGSGERREIRLTTVSEVYNPSWSPDGSRIVLSALKGGLSDLFLYDMAGGTLTQLTADPFADLHPAWSPDGRTIAMATDRFTSNVADLQFGALRVGLLDVKSGNIRPLTANDEGKQINPQWAPDGQGLFFVSDRDGVSNVYRAAVATGALQQITRVAGGVSGITATSPALAVASRRGTLAFSVYTNGRYELHTLNGCGACADIAVAPPPVRPDIVEGTDIAEEPSLPDLLDSPRDGLPEATEFVTAEYDDRLRLESLSQPFVGATSGNTFGGAVRASFGVVFGDFLRDRQLQAAVRVGTDIDDLAAQVAYTHRRGRWNWGLTSGFAPSRFYAAKRALTREGELVTRETTHLQYVNQWGGLTARYNIDRSRRIELGLGVRRTGFEWQTVTRITDAARDEVVSRTLDESPAGAPAYLSDATVAFVHDTAISGPTGPVFGQRLRLEVEPSFGGLRYADVRADARRYFMPVRPLTIATRIEHVGRYGPSAGDPRLTPLVVGLQTLVRGYDLRTFAADECGRAATTCSLMNELTGSRLALMNVELRAPLLGLLTGDLEYGRWPIEAIAFADAGFLWTRQDAGGTDRDRFRSVGAGGRANLGGFVLEVTAVRPFDRTQGGWTTSILLRPGW